MTSPKEALKAAIHLVSDCVPDDLVEKPTYLALFNAAIPVAKLHEQAVELLPWFEKMYKRIDETDLDQFERIGQIFYDECGCLRPGKDDPLCESEEQRKRWDLWINTHLDKARVLLTRLALK